MAYLLPLLKATKIWKTARDKWTVKISPISTPSGSMSLASAAPLSHCYDIKSADLPLLALLLKTSDIQAVEAALKASHERFRPIVMTSIAFILGVVPLLTASGAGAAARVSIGITVFSGMIASTCLAVALVPIFFVEIQNMTLKRQAKRDQKSLTQTDTASKGE